MSLTLSLAGAILILALSTSAFQTAPGKASAGVKIQQARQDPLNMASIPEPSFTEVPYGEDSRKFRRTVYSHDDWVKHRSPDRFWNNLKTTTKSGIYKVSEQSANEASVTPCLGNSVRL